MLTEPAPVRTGSSARFAYQPALDGLRAVAVSVVVLYHLNYGWMRGGFMGVDAFFVLSGFLITSLLLREWRHTDRVHFGQFWSRRARRLLPAVFLMIAFATVYGSTIVSSAELGGLRWDAVSGVLYYANWHFISSGQSYFALFAAPSPLTHLWSLAIEEQFYLVWPVVFALVAARGRLRAVFAVCVSGVVVSQIVMVAMYDPADPSRAYYATPARLNTMLVGCALAVLLMIRPDLIRRCSRALLTLIALVALAMCTVAWMRATASRTFFWGGDTLFALAFAALLFAFQGARTPLRWVFELPPLVWLGTISYGVYLWHWPAIVFLTEDRTGLSGTTLDVVRVAVTLAVSYASIRLLERPVRHSRAPVLRWVLPATAVTLGIVLVATAGATGPPNFAARNGGHPCKDGSTTEVATARAELEHLGVPDVPDLRGRNVTIIGDSRACSLLVGFQAAAPIVDMTVGNGSVLGCGVVSRRFDVSGLIPAEWRDRCPGAVTQALASVRSRANVLVWWSAWEGEDLLLGDRVVKPAAPEHDFILRVRMEQWLAHQVAPDVQVAIVLTPQPNSTSNPDAVSHPKQLNRVFEGFAAAHPDRVHLLDLDRFLCPNGAPCDPTVDGQPVRSDGTHLTPEGAAMVTRWMLPQIADILRAAPAAQPVSR